MLKYVKLVIFFNEGEGLVWGGERMSVMREKLKVYLVIGWYDFSDIEFLKWIEIVCCSGVILV